MTARRIAVGRIRRTLVLICATVACIRIGGTQERRLVDLNEGTVALRLSVAQGYATGAQLERLREVAKGRFPSPTDRDSATLGLGWQHMNLADGEHVMLEVTFMPKAKGVDAKAVADYVAQQVLQDVKPKLKSSEGREVEWRGAAEQPDAADEALGTRARTHERPVRRRRLVPARASMDGGTASQLVASVRRTNGEE